MHVTSYLLVGIYYRYEIRDLGKSYGHVDENGTWHGAIRRVMDEVRLKNGIEYEDKSPLFKNVIFSISDLGFLNFLVMFKSRINGFRRCVIRGKKACKFHTLTPYSSHLVCFIFWWWRHNQLCSAVDDLTIVCATLVMASYNWFCKT